jgi:hypothetical protein
VNNDGWSQITIKKKKRKKERKKKGLDNPRENGAWELDNS